MPRYKILLEYEGTNYHGWQVQNGEVTVQAELEKALSTALRTRTGVVGSGRTDAGVHARGQVAHFDGEGSVDLPRLSHSLNGLLPNDIAVVSVQRAHDAFHARYDAVSRRYRYYVTMRPTAFERQFRSFAHTSTDFDLMNEAATTLVTTTDFSSFCRTQSETKNRICSVSRAVWVSESVDGFRYFEIVADRFLHGMVRAIVGTLLEIGRGLRSASDLEAVLATRDRPAAGPAAPACGLVLEEVTYPDHVMLDPSPDRPE